MREIVCVSNTDWHPFPTRKQQVMSRLRDARILYFNPPLTYAAPLKDKTASDRMRDYKKEPERIKDDLHVYATPPVLPLYNKRRFINKLNQRRLAAFIRARMECHGYENPILWLYPPFCADIIPLIPHSAVVYDCTDKHSAFKGLIDPAVVDAMEADLARQSNVVFATAKGLYETLKVYNPNSYLLPNGANFELFNKAGGDPDNLPFPDGLFNIKAPIFGFVGMLQECVEYSYIVEAAKAHPEWSFVLVGKPLPGVDISCLSGYKNIHLVGFKPHKELPGYLARFDVLLNLFRAGDLSQDVSPLKFYEYLATGKPIVSTPQPLQVLDYSDVTLIAGTPQEFVAACKRALNERNRWNVTQRISYGRAASWDSRVMEMERILAENNL